MKLQELFKAVGVTPDKGRMSGHGTKDGMAVYVGVPDNWHEKYHGQINEVPAAKCEAASAEEFVALFLKRWPTWERKAREHKAKMDAKHAVWDQVREMAEKAKSDIDFDAQRLCIRIGPDIDLKRVTAIIKAADGK